MDEKEFHIGDVLSVTTGKLLSPSGMDGVYKILNHMTGVSLFTHQLPRAMESCAPVLLKLYPKLADENPQIHGRQELDSYLEGVTQRFGKILAVPVLDDGAYSAQNPISEYVDMKSANSTQH